MEREARRDRWMADPIPDDGPSPDEYADLERLNRKAAASGSDRNRASAEIEAAPSLPIDSHCSRATSAGEPAAER